VSAKASIRFWVTESERRAIVDAARDAHMEVTDYARLMVLAAAGMGGVTEHLERAIDASADVDKRHEVISITREELLPTWNPEHRCDECPHDAKPTPKPRRSRR